MTFFDLRATSGRPPGRLFGPPGLHFLTPGTSGMAECQLNQWNINDFEGFWGRHATSGRPPGRLFVSPGLHGARDLMVCEVFARCLRVSVLASSTGFNGLRGVCEVFAS